MANHILIGFHGCEEALAQQVALKKDNLLLSKKDYDWLGNGIYFWENDPKRALQWAKEKNCKNPAVLGAVIDAGNILDLTLGEGRAMLEWAYKMLVDDCFYSGRALPKNTTSGLNRLDCAVIQTLHKGLRLLNKTPLDTIRGLFEEGAPLYRGSKFLDKSHIQIAVKNPACVKGYFLPK